MKRLLIVDDSAIIRRRIERAHGLDDYEVVGTAEDGREAINMARELKPDSSMKRHARQWLHYCRMGYSSPPHHWQSLP